MMPGLYANPAAFFVETSTSLRKDVVEYALQNIETEIQRTPFNVRALRDALIHGDWHQGMKTLPEALASKILDMANYWSAVEKRSITPFYVNRLNCRVLKFGPVAGTPMGVALCIEPCSRGWNTRESEELSIACVEVDVKSPNGRSKLPKRRIVACKLHPLKNWKIRSTFFARNEDFMLFLNEGDTLELYFRSNVEYPNVLVESLKMVLHFDAGRISKADRS